MIADAAVGENADLHNADPAGAHASAGEHTHGTPHDHDHHHEHDGLTGDGHVHLPDGSVIVETQQHHGPSHDGSVVMDVGGDIGAVALYVPASLEGVELDIIGVGPGTITTHSLVRPRVMPGTTLYAAVYPNLPQGAYRIPAAAGFPSLDVQVTGGSVAQVHWAAS